MKTLYDMLDIEPDDDAGKLKDAFRKAVKVSHPDLNTDDPEAPARFMQAVRANAILSDPELRAVYDRMLEFERQQYQPAPTPYNIVPDAIVVVVLAIVMAGAYTLYANLPEITVYLPKISVTEVKAVADVAREGASAAAVKPAPSVEENTGGGSRDGPESAEVSAPNSVAPNPVAPNPVAPATNDDVAAADAAPAPTDAVASSAAAAEPPPPVDANSSDEPRDTLESAPAAAPSAAAPAANNEVAAEDAAATPSAAAPAANGNADATAPADGTSPSAPVKDAQFYREQGIASYRNGDLLVAVADFDQAIRLDPNLTDAYIDRGIALYRLHNLDRAFADVAQAMRLESSHRAAAPPLPRTRP